MARRQAPDLRRILLPMARVAYLMSHYPAISHAFVLREVEHVRAAGVDLHTLSIHRAPTAGPAVGGRPARGRDHLQRAPDERRPRGRRAPRRARALPAPLSVDAGAGLAHRGAGSARAPLAPLLLRRGDDPAAPLPPRPDRAPPRPVRRQRHRRRHAASRTTAAAGASTARNAHGASPCTARSSSTTSPSTRWPPSSSTRALRSRSATSGAASSCG